MENHGRVNALARGIRCFMLVGNVADTFEIEGRGVVVATDTTYEQLPRDLKLKIGDPIELRISGEVTLRTTIAGIEHCDPWSPKHTFAFLLPRDVIKSQVPIGSSVWRAAQTLL